MPSPSQFVQVLAPFGGASSSRGNKYPFSGGHRASLTRPAADADTILADHPTAYYGSASGLERPRPMLPEMDTAALYPQPGTGRDRCHAG